MTLVVGGKEIATKPLRVSGGSVMPMSDADRKTWHDTTLSLHQLQQAANDAADAVTTLGTQLTTAESLLKTAGSAPSRGNQAVEEAGKRLAALRPQLGVGQTGGGWRRLRRRPEPERAGAHRPAEGADHGVHVPADRDADPQRHRGTRGPDEGGAGGQRSDRRRAAAMRKTRRERLKPAALKTVTIP